MLTLGLLLIVIGTAAATHCVSRYQMTRDPVWGLAAACTVGVIGVGGYIVGMLTGA